MCHASPVVLLAFLSSASSSPAPLARDPLGIWTPARETALSAAGIQRSLAPGRYGTLALNREGLEALLARAPLEGTSPGEGVELTLPTPDGHFDRFLVEESPVMAQELAAKYPEIRTYRGQGLDDPAASARFSLTPLGFHAMILSGGTTVYVEPWSREDTRHYATFDVKDHAPPAPGETSCHVSDSIGRDDLRAAAGAAVPVGAWGTSLYKYRAALAATGEFTQAAGGKTAAISVIAITVSDFNAIYERDLAVRLELVANNDQLVYTIASTDPYTNSDKNRLPQENQTNLDAVIGSANYDVGHVFGYGSGGVSGVQVVCTDYGKGYGTTTTPEPGVLHFRRLVAHEMGHQFGGLHTHNAASDGACGWAGSREAGSAYEPGSGSTIMSYGGTCGGQNVVAERDPYLHTHTLDQMQWYITNYAQPGGNCQPVVTATGNTPPTVEAGAAWVIPEGTPFTLTGSGSDANGDSITYTWEEMDLGTQSPPNYDDGSRPLFRSVVPGASPARTFPKLESVLSGAGCPWECLPTTQRTMDFRLTARDNRAGGGGTNYDSTQVTSTDGVGPFVITAPTASNWPAGSSQTVTWNVAGTDAAPVSCANVKISLSTDSGATFPTVLAASTPNDGSQAVSIPTPATPQGRIRIDCIGNIFFNISKPNFNISTLMSISDPSVVEGNAGTANAVFNVSLSAASIQTITVRYATAPGTAAAAVDYTTTTGTLTFDPGVTSRTISVPVIGDTLYEANETFVVNLSVVTGGATIADAQGQGTIQNDDPLPNLSINDATVTEGATGTRYAVFTLSLSAASGATTTVNYTTADNTATAPSDYTALSGVVTFAPGITTRTVNVVVKGDVIAEPSETFLVNLSAAVGATVVDNQGLGTIANDDFAGTFFFGAGSYSVSEGVASSLITVKRTGGVADGITVGYTTTDGSATVAAGDYTAVSGTLTFKAGIASQTFSVPIGTDLVYELPQTVMLRLTGTGGYGAALGEPRAAVLTIRDRHLVPKLQFTASNYTVKESGPNPAITVSRVGSTANAVTVNYATVNGTAVAGSDYAATAGTLTFAVGETSKTVTVPILNDSTYEPTEKLTLTLSNPQLPDQAILGTLISTTVNILDDDPAVAFSAADFKAAEAAAKAVVTVKRLGPTSGTITVDYATSDGTATLADNDYTATTGTLTFKPGFATLTFTVPLTKDTRSEGSEVVNLTLSNANPPAALGTLHHATVTITDTSPVVQFSAATYNAAETALKAVISVVRTTNVGESHVTYATSNGTAIAGNDYTATSGTLTFGPGQTLKTFNVFLANDMEDESPETLNLTLTAVDIPLGTPSTAVVTIGDNDTAGKIQLSSAVYGVDEAAGTAIITVTRAGGTASNAKVNYATSNGTAIAGSDYTATSGTLTFGAGELSKTFTVPIANDGTVEVGESIIITLSNPSFGVTLGTPATATLWIVSNE